MKDLTRVILLLAACLFDVAAGDEMSDADRMRAEGLKSKAVATAKESVAEHEQAVRQARMNRSPQLASALKSLSDAKKELAAVSRKPLPEYLKELGEARPATELKTSEGVATGVIDSTGLSVVFPYTVAYVPQESQIFEFSFVLVAFNKQKPTEGFIEIDGRPSKIEAWSSDENVVEIKPDPQFTLSPFICRFAGPGRATVTVSAGRYKAEQEVEVIQVPVHADASSGDVIEAMGFPTEKKKVYVTWPDDKVVDCFIYSPKAGQPFIGEHWTYAKYPSLVLSIENGKLVQLGTRKVDNESRRAISVPVPNLEEKQPAVR